MLERLNKSRPKGGWPPSSAKLPARRSPALRRLTPRKPPLRKAGPLGWLGAADPRLLRTLRTKGHTETSEDAMEALGMIGAWGAIWIALGVGMGVADSARRNQWLRTAAVAPAAVIANFAIKVAVGRDRPLIDEHPALARAPSKLSFPSAHATSSLAAAVAMGRVQPAARPPLYALAGSICISRPFLGMHYPSDVLAGIALGSLIGRLTPGLSEPTVEDRMIDLVANRPPDPQPTSPGPAPAAPDPASTEPT
ncbi:hypothetical protein BH10ACT11_BH10ACT11_18600 [soil metagenome]